MKTNLIDIQIKDETAPLEAVILGTARSIISPFWKYVDPAEWETEYAPDDDEITDPKSRLHLMDGLQWSGFIFNLDID